MKSILKLAGVLLLLLIALAAGYYLGAKKCAAPADQIAPEVAAPVRPQPQSATPTPAAEKPPETELVFSNYNSAAVSKNPTDPTTFVLKEARKIYLIQDYHWNGAKGKTPGTIGLRSADGQDYGPWQAKGDPGQGGVPDAYWTVYPDVEIPAGTYTIVDSDPASWAQNTGSKGLGMSQVYAVK